MDIILLVTGGIAFLAAAVLCFFFPRLLIAALDKLEKKWALDKELFMSSFLARVSSAAVFLTATLFLFYAAYVLTT